jgi:hypothetical protein
MIEVLQAAKARKTIQYERTNGEWTDLIRPFCDFTRYRYRVKPEPLHLEVGKEYETEDGTVYRIDAANPERTRFVSWETSSHKTEMFFDSGFSRDNNVCLVREHKPTPKKVVVWLNEYSNWRAAAHKTMEEANFNASSNRIGRHRVELVSGKWDE